MPVPRVTVSRSMVTSPTAAVCGDITWTLLDSSTASDRLDEHRRAGNSPPLANAVKRHRERQRAHRNAVAIAHRGHDVACPHFRGRQGRGRLRALIGSAAPSRRDACAGIPSASPTPIFCAISTAPMLDENARISLAVTRLRRARQRMRRRGSAPRRSSSAETSNAVRCRSARRHPSPPPPSAACRSTPARSARSSARLGAGIFQR